MKKLLYLISLGSMLVGINVQANLSEQNLKLVQLIEKAIQNNPEIASVHTRADAESSLITSRYTLDDPMIGVSQLNRGNETTYATIAQKVKFPTKYYLEGQAQKSKTQAFKSMAEAKKWEVRGRVINLFYSIYTNQKITQLTQANMDAVREFARVAEKRYASGKGARGDSMKAHFELTRLELDLIRLKQQNEALQADLKATVGHTNYSELKFEKEEFKIPSFYQNKLNTSEQELAQSLQSKSPKLQSEFHLLSESDAKSTLSKWEFAPDFEFRFQQRISGQPNDSQIYSVMMTFPLFFWKKGAEASHASAIRLSREYHLKNETDQILSKVKDLHGRVKTGADTLKIYKTSLIPQAQGAFNSSRAAYRASKTSFLDLLDSERSLYQVKTDYYRSLSQYISNLAQLEAVLGFSVSELYSSKPATTGRNL